ncbi:Uroporphyrinogen-III synthase [bacterium HR10]|uniref:Uroporphyrinogen-III synthase n=1 Tax=uncultured Acidobacteriota bacterium TaxID=171953 RepID=H5S9D4_9BACT|nr:uroporphyrinogen-III synthase [uncultured Acidobacteriota bacterium]GBC82340.1 Uroporphyrinogen-III synthase [bacterium HR10]
MRSEFPSHRPCIVLITRPRDQAEELADRLRDAGAHPLIFPTIEIAPPQSWDACDERIRQIADYTDVIFTSPNAVRFFLERCARFFDLAHLRTRTFHAVGPKTAEAIAAYGLTTAPLPEAFDAAHLAAALASEPMASQRRFLFPRGDLAEETLLRRLRAAGLSVDDVIVYRTVKPDPPPEVRQAIWAALARGEIRVVAFFSPSSVRNFLDFFPDFPALFREPQRRPPKIAVIGETTARACQAMGLPVHLRPEAMSGVPPAQALARAILRACLAERSDETA